jgi:hypothetical protein
MKKMVPFLIHLQTWYICVMINYAQIHSNMIMVFFLRTSGRLLPRVLCLFHQRMSLMKGLLPGTTSSLWLVISWWSCFYLSQPLRLLVLFEYQTDRHGLNQRCRYTQTTTNPGCPSQEEPLISRTRLKATETLNQKAKHSAIQREDMGDITSVLKRYWHSFRVWKILVKLCWDNWFPLEDSAS